MFFQSLFRFVFDWMRPQQRSINDDPQQCSRLFAQWSTTPRPEYLHVQQLVKQDSRRHSRQARRSTRTPHRFIYPLLAPPKLSPELTSLVNAMTRLSISPAAAPLPPPPPPARPRRTLPVKRSFETVTADVFCAPPDSLDAPLQAPAVLKPCLRKAPPRAAAKETKHVTLDVRPHMHTIPSRAQQGLTGCTFAAFSVGYDFPDTLQDVEESLDPQNRISLRRIGRGVNAKYRFRGFRAAFNTFKKYEPMYTVTVNYEFL